MTPATLCRTLAAALVLPAWPALAAEVDRVPLGSGNDGALITVTGEFRQGDDRKLVRALLETEGTAIVQFDSPGGSLIAGLAMGRAIRLNGATTLVPDGATCASACGLAWMGGVRRAVGNGARVGFHAAYYVDDQGRAIETGQGNALIGAYLNQLGLSEKAVLYITGAAPEEMAWLTPDEAEDLGIPMQRAGRAPTPAPGRTATPGQPAPAEPRFFQPAPEPARPATSPAPAPAPGTDPLRLQGSWQVVANAPAGYMNVRQGPGTAHPVLFTVQPATPVGVVSCRVGDAGDAGAIWCQIISRGKRGWIARSGLEPEGTAAALPAAPAAMADRWRIKPGISGGFANVRTGPGTMHSVAFTLPAGSRGLRVERCQPPDAGGGRFDWCLIVAQGRSGWVSSNGIEQGG
jgi:uncharacterized protein YraI